VKEAILAVAAEFTTYGTPRITAELQRRGIRVNHKRVSRLLDELGLKQQSPPPRVRTTDSCHEHPRFPNRVRDLQITRRHQVWVADLTYVHLDRGFVYLAVVMDVHTRMIMGWNLARSLDDSLAIGALQRALRHATPEIHHSDQGSQYASAAYGKALPERTLRSMARTGAAWENGHCERLIGTIKAEEVKLSEYADIHDARQRIGTFIEQVYNHKRIHSSLGYLTPAEFATAYEEDSP